MRERESECVRRGVIGIFKCIRQCNGSSQSFFNVTLEILRLKCMLGRSIRIN
jgi:hypothetical protein